MQISIINGTLAQIRETLSPSSGYFLPESVTVTGARVSYSDFSGSVTLSSLTSTIVVTAVASETAPSSINRTRLGTATIVKKMFGTREVLKEVLNGVVVYQVSVGPAPGPDGVLVDINGNFPVDCNNNYLEPTAAVMRASFTLANSENSATSDHENF